ncbi:MAG: hypothetical protein NZL91_01645 [Thermoflexales bacterium]|nr:hypothetical protein [Thermoflexales bacterium]MCS7325159.1 hypothetical protein [Thermoflexales bacterium]MDW8292768.1 hypothetical protein [Anaerolineae bacterium]
MPKPPTVPSQPRFSSPRYEREQQLRRWVIIGSAATAVLVALLIAAAVLQIVVFEPQRVVVTVEGEPIRVQQLHTRMRYTQFQVLNRYQQLSAEAQQLTTGGNSDATTSFMVQFYQQQLQRLQGEATAESIANTALNALIEEALIRREAERRGVVITSEEVQETLERDFGFFRKTLTPFPTATPLPTPTPNNTAVLTATATPFPTATPRAQPTSISEAEFNQLYQRTLQGYAAIGIGEAELRELVRNSLYRQRLQALFASETPTRALHFRFNYVRFNQLADAERAVQRLANGEITFSALISETNAITQPAPIGTGVELGEWISIQNVERQYSLEILAALQNAELGKPTGVITSAGSFYVLLPLGREERPLSAFDLQTEQRRRFEDWLDEARGDANRVQRFIAPTSVIPNDVRERAREFLRQVGAG